MIEKVGLIPINDYIHGLSFRGFGKQYSIQYTKENYDLNISREINKALFWYKDNIYEKFQNDNPLKIKDDGTREYFNKYGRKRYIDFINTFRDYNGQEYFFYGLKPSVVHHIYPLTRSQDNGIYNLIHVSRFSHDILHKNPKEESKKYNYQAVDYLYYLANSGFKYMIDKYKLHEYADKGSKTIARIYKGSIEDEMDEFYKHINVLP